MLILPRCLSSPQLPNSEGSVIPLIPLIPVTRPGRVCSCQRGSCTTLRLRWLVQVLPGTRLPGSSVSGNEVPGLLVWGACQDGGDLGEMHGAPALVNPFPTSDRFGSYHWNGPRLSRVALVRCDGRHLALHHRPQVTSVSASCIPPLRVYREMMLPWVSGRKREGGKQFSASARQQEPSLSLANLRPIPHGLSEPRGLCVLRSTQAAPAHRLLCAAAQLMACSFHKCRWSAVPRPRASLLIT